MEGAENINLKNKVSGSGSRNCIGLVIADITHYIFLYCKLIIL